MIFRFFRRSNPGRELARIRHQNHREHVHAVCDDMRARMGLEPVRWPR
jgi:hypothetical protein